MSKENAYTDTLLDVPETAGRVCRPGGKVERVGVEPYVLKSEVITVSTRSLKRWTK